MLLRIGDFSKLSQATIKMLRHYDDLGLLKPAHIDPFTNYRYYSIEQLSRVHRIIALKELGISLEQIGHMLNSEPSKEQIKGMLALQEAEIEQRMRAEQARLALVRFRLRMLDMEEIMPEMDIIVKKLEPVRVLQYRQTGVGWPEIEQMGREIAAAVKQAGITFDANTYQMSIIRSQDYRVEDLDMTMTVSVPDDFHTDVPLATLGTLTVGYTDPVANAVTYIHHGDLTVNVQERLTMLQRWCVANHYALGDEYRLLFYKGPMAGYAEKDWVVEIQHVVEPLAE